MAVTNYNLPGTAASETIIGGNATDWTNPDNIKIDDSSEASMSVSTASSDVGAYIKATNFGFTSSDVPLLATINGIEVEYRRREGSGTDNINTDHCRLIIAGVTSVNNVSTMNTVEWVAGANEAAAETITEGDATNLWGEVALTQIQVTDSTFGVAIACNLAGTTPDAFIDYIKLRVYYTATVNTISETATATDSFVGRKVTSDTFTETATVTDSFVGIKSTSNTISETAAATDTETSVATMRPSLSETATATDSLAALWTTSASFTETATSSDNYAGKVTDSDVFTETATATDRYVTQTTDSINETITATDIFTGVKISSAALSETITATDNYVNPAQATDSIIETATASDAFTGIEIANDNFSETISASDSYDSSVIPNPSTIIIQPTGGAADDPWKKYLLWLKEKKKKQWRKRAKNQRLPEVMATRIVEKASQEVARQELELKRPYYAESNEQQARHAAQKAIQAIYEQTWALAVRDAGHAVKQEEEEEEMFLMMM